MIREYIFWSALILGLYSLITASGPSWFAPLCAFLAGFNGIRMLNDWVYRQLLIRQKTDALKKLIEEDPEGLAEKLMDADEKKHKKD
jgi:hypothetical protein